MNLIKKYELHILLFTTNAVSMIMELVAARILSPYYGTSNLVWTIIISMMLFANAVGNFWGGKLADKRDISKLKRILLFISASTTLLIAIINRQVLSIVTSSNNSVSMTIAAVIIVLFLIPCTTIGMFSPIINKAVLSQTGDIGNKSGVIYTVITIGSLLGTMVGGLVLIPNFGCNSILLGIAVFFAVYGAIYSVFSQKKVKGIIANTIVVIFTIVSTVNNSTSDGTNNVIIIDTDERYVRIFEGEHNGEKVRYFGETATGAQSAAFVDPQKRNELVFEYAKGYNIILDKLPEAREFLMFGGAGYSYPRYLVSHYPDKTIDVVEIDGGITEAAKKYFYLQDFIDEYGTDRLGLITDDGRLYVERTDKKYDVILNDAFMGDFPARALATQEAVEAIKAGLRENGIYATNLIGAFEGANSTFFKSEIKTIASVFKYVWLQNANANGGSNWVLIASDYNYEFDTVDIVLSDEDMVFTDDYSPVEFFSSGF